MQQHQVHSFLERYFTANDCEMIEKHPAYLTVQLTTQLDKLLMNRPFYWHYLEKTGGTPEPMKVTFITDEMNNPKNIKGEAVQFGSPRLHQLFATTKSLGGFIRLYEEVHTNEWSSIPLHPWLCLNIKISFQCDRKKDVLLSLGLNLIHGQIVSNFYDKLSSRKLTRKIPDYCFTLSPLIKEKSGLARMKKMIITYIENEDDSWAIEAVERMSSDLALLERFYEDYDEKPESYFVEKEALVEQYEPTIHVTVVNGGIFYMQQQVF